MPRNPIEATDTPAKPGTKVRGTEILATDTQEQYRQKLARIAMDEMYQFVAVLDAKGTLLEVNRAALEGAGLSLSDVEGKPFWECFWWTVSTDIQAALRQAISSAAGGEFVRYDVEIYGRAHGKETIIIDFSMIPVTDETGKVVFIVPEGRDITEKKAQERESARKNAGLQALLERIRELDEIKTQSFANVSHELRKHVNDLLDISKLDAGKLKIELQALRPSSVPRREIGPSQPATLRTTVLVVEDNIDMNRFIVRCLGEQYEVISAFNGQEGLEKALAVLPSIIVSDIMMPVMSGTVMIAEIRKRPELDDIPVLVLSAKADEELKVQLLDGGAQDFVAKPFSERDLLVRVRNLISIREARLESSRARAVAVAAMEELKLKDQRKNEFLAMLAHELRNPLAALTTAQYLMARDGATDPRLLRLRATSMRQVKHLVRLVDDLLDVARITEGKIDLRRERVDLAVVLRDALQETRMRMEVRGQAVSTVLGAGPFWVEGDPTRLEQIFNNLLVNATKYTDHGGRIAVRCTSEQRGDSAWVVVEIEDTGQGLAPAMVEQVFNLFTQVNASLDRAGGGLGIGLTLVRRLLELQGGTVQARSEGQGRGSTFTVRLPLAAAPVEVLSAVSPRPPRDSSINRRVVVVEDNEEVREVMKVLLESWGHEVEVAADGVEAIALILSSLPDMAFIDVGLPGLDGFQVVQSVRASSDGAKTLLVALTGYGDAPMRARAVAAGFDHHLVKPVSPEHLEQVLARRSF